jgi:hypothetical protein
VRGTVVSTLPKGVAGPKRVRELRPKLRALETDASRLNGRVTVHGIHPRPTDSADPTDDGNGSGPRIFLRRLAHHEPSGSTQAAAKPARGCSLAASNVQAKVRIRRNRDVKSQTHSSRFADQPGTSSFVNRSAFNGTNPKDEPIASGLPVIREQSRSLP